MLPTGRTARSCGYGNGCGTGLNGGRSDPVTSTLPPGARVRPGAVSGSAFVCCATTMTEAERGAWQNQDERPRRPPRGLRPVPGRVRISRRSNPTSPAGRHTPLSGGTSTTGSGRSRRQSPCGGKDSSNASARGRRRSRSHTPPTPRRSATGLMRASATCARSRGSSPSCTAPPTSGTRPTRRTNWSTSYSPATRGRVRTSSLLRR